MIGLVLVTHGRLAEEFVVAMEHVVGTQEQVASICIGPEDDMEGRRADIAAAIKSVDSGRGVIVLSDLFGGTPSNLAISLMEAGRVEVIAEGPRAACERLLALLRGPGTPGAVTLVVERFDPPRGGLNGFRER